MTKGIYTTRAGIRPVLVLAGAALLSSEASAGGFSRGEADTDILFVDGVFVVRSSALYVTPQREFATVGGSDSSDEPYTDSYWSPSIAMKVKLGDHLSCAFTYSQPFGASATYGADAQQAELAASIAAGVTPNPTSRMAFSTDEYATTCDINFAAGPGNVHILGGVFIERFEYKENTWLGNIRLEDDQALGYRIGAAYDIPDYALRLQVLYRSETKHDAGGTFAPSALLGLPMEFAAVGEGRLPQSLKLSAQTGVAPGWLVYGSLTWTDWSVLQTFSYDIVGLSSSEKTFNFRDGYTVQIGVGHEFDDRLAGTINLTWDDGTGTGADINTDSWTLGLGGEYKTDIGTFGVGAAISYLTAGSQRVASGASYDGTADADWAAAVGLSYTRAF